jgi:pre-60S factor REI1
MSQFTTVPVVTSCNTCKAAFTSIELVREHYRTDWHVLNSKRRASNLACLSLDEFRRLPSTSKPKPSPQSTTKFNKNNNSQTTTAGKFPVAAASSLPGRNGNVNNATPHYDEPETKSQDNINTSRGKVSFENKLKHIAVELGVSDDRASVVAQMASSTHDEQDEIESEGTDNKLPDIDTSSTSCIFDDTQYSTTEECVRYMELTYGFFIPEREYLIDLPGLISYLNEKVKLGGICIYCQKQFVPGWPLQNHMKSKSHCKIAYEEDIDMDEFEPFYDFSTSYEPQKSNNNNDVDVYIQSDDDDEFEDVDDDDEDLVDKTLEVAANGELILTDGRVVGHRNYRRYYKQKYRPDDTRESTRAQKREEILRLRSHFGGIEVESFALQKMSDTELMIMLLKKHKYIRKMEQVSQRAQQKAALRSQRREFMNTKDRLRSTMNKTDKIRDYHSIIM